MHTLGDTEANYDENYLHGANVFQILTLCTARILMGFSGSFKWLFNMFYKVNYMFLKKKLDPEFLHIFEGIYIILLYI